MKNNYRGWEVAKSANSDSEKCWLCGRMDIELRYFQVVAGSYSLGGKSRVASCFACSSRLPDGWTGSDSTGVDK